ncbi:MAG: hypothetical protein KKG47_09270 [Proteobacteria bacterium]|nr:hypothetical protein [Pseudomonadota bacterium]MBU1737146.1 hypothetical protein [Pseudomonadota bacterium]
MHRLNALLKILLLLTAVQILSGCAVGQKYAIEQADPNLSLAGSGSVAVTVQDQREYIVSGRNQPQLAGIIRGGWGNPFFVSTTSNRPLVEDMAESLSNSLNKKGFKVTPVTVLPQDDAVAVAGKLTTAGGDKLIHLGLLEWKPDMGAAGNLGLKFDFRLAVMNGSGNVLAQKDLTGFDDLGQLRGARFMVIYEQKVREAFSSKMEQLFNSPEVLQALR